jgi:hypothetical protein
MTQIPNPTLSVTDASPDWELRIPEWRKVRDALDGEDAVKARGAEYLMKPRGMKPIDYTNYKGRAMFYGVADRTLLGLTGLVFRVEPEVALPGRLTPLVESLTPEATPVRDALHEAVSEVLSLGRYGLLVDLPEGETTDALPYVATYRAEDVFRWEETLGRGADGAFKRRLVRVLLRERPTTANGETEILVRELIIQDDVYVQNVYVETASEDTLAVLRFDEPTLAGWFRLRDTVTPRVAGRTLTEIPFIFINPMDQRARTVKPPMLDLVVVNFAHYRNSADHENALYLTASPTPFIFGVEESKVPKGIGSGVIWWSSSHDTRAGMIEFEGKGLAAQQKAMLDKENLMAALGARLIADVRRENVTAETTRLQSRAETSVITAVVASVESGFRRAFAIAAGWVAAGAAEIVLKINRDYIETRLSANELREVVAGWQAGAYSRQTLHENLQRGEIVPPERTVEAELELIENELGNVGITIRGANLDDEALAAVEAALVARLAGGTALADAVAAIAAKAAAPPEPVVPPGGGPAGGGPPGGAGDA